MQFEGRAFAVPAGWHPPCLVSDVEVHVTAEETEEDRAERAGKGARAGRAGARAGARTGVARSGADAAGADAAGADAAGADAAGADGAAADVNPAAEKSLDVYLPAPVVRDEHSEDWLTRLVEQQTAKIPSSWFLLAAMGTLAASLALEISGNERMSRFVGMWTPTLLITGVYNKLVKELAPRPRA
jgi:hypothetical protein